MPSSEPAYWGLRQAVPHRFAFGKGRRYLHATEDGRWEDQQAAAAQCATPEAAVEKINSPGAPKAFKKARFVVGYDVHGIPVEEIPIEFE